MFALNQKDREKDVSFGGGRQGMTRVTIELGAFDRRRDDRAHERHRFERDRECGDGRRPGAVLSTFGRRAAGVGFVRRLVRTTGHPRV